MDLWCVSFAVPVGYSLKCELTGAAYLGEQGEGGWVWLNAALVRGKRGPRAHTI